MIVTPGGGFHGELPDGSVGASGPGADDAGQPAQAAVDQGATSGGAVAIPSVHTHGR